jgi:mRNA-degrading endonuclease RelE of RelBE toxin-antitoxin system
MKFVVEATQSALDDLEYLKKAVQNTVLDAIETQLTVSPLTPTRNRKPLRPNDLSAWEMRVGVYRVFYDVDAEAGQVFVKAVGWKEHNKLFIRGEEYTL